MREQALLQTVLQGYRRILGHRLAGFYVHGSIAFGCFTWETGDIDFLAVVTEPLTQGNKEAIIRLLLSLTPDAPPKGFEMSVVLQDCCRSFRHPMPFELHYSNAHRARAEADLSAFCREMHGEDPDLAAHVTVVRRVGLALCGPAPGEMFAEVPPDCYRDSILLDIAGAETEIAADPALTEKVNIVAGDFMTADHMKVNEILYFNLLKGIVRDELREEYAAAIGKPLCS